MLKLVYPVPVFSEIGIFIFIENNIYKIKSFSLKTQAILDSNSFLFDLKSMEYGRPKGEKSLQMIKTEEH